MSVGPNYESFTQIEPKTVSPGEAVAQFVKNHPEMEELRREIVGVTARSVDAGAELSEIDHRNIVEYLLKGDQIVGVRKSPSRTEVLRRNIEFDSYGNRQLATYMVSEMLDLGLVPVTVNLDNGKSVQKYIARAAYPDRDQDQQRVLSLFGLIVWNTDDYFGDVNSIVDLKGKVWGTDNELNFAHDAKYAPTVPNWGGEKIPKEVVEKLRKFNMSDKRKETMRAALKSLISDEEADACIARIEYIVKVLPEDGMIPQNMRVNFHPGAERYQH